MTTFFVGAVVGVSAGVFVVGMVAGLFLGRRL